MYSNRKTELGPIALLVPVEEEFEPFRKLFSDLKPVDSKSPWEIYETQVANRRLLLMLCDCGPACAGAAGERIIAEFKPDAILQGGSAGGLNKNLLPGDIVVGNKYVVLASKDTTESRLSLGLNPSLLRFRKNHKRFYYDYIEGNGKLLAFAWEVIMESMTSLPAWSGPGLEGGINRPPKFIVGTIGSADTWTTDLDEVQRLNTEYGAECEDMESAYLALICALHDIPFLAIRAISDNAFHQKLDPDQVNAALAAAGETSAKIVAGVIKKMAK